MRYKITLPCRLLSYDDDQYIYVFHPELFKFLMDSDSSLHVVGSSRKVCITVSVYPSPYIENKIFDIEIDKSFIKELAKLKMEYE